MSEAPIIPRKNFIDLIEEFKLDDFTTLQFKCLRFTSGNISLIELFHIVLTVRLFKAKRIMEFGTFNGRTTLNMALNADGAELFTVDLPRTKKLRTKYELYDKGMRGDLDETGYVGVKGKLWQGQPKEITKRINLIWEDTARLQFVKYPNIDFIFIDASHTYDNCKNDSYNAHKMISEHGIIFWHDYAGGWTGVTQALNEYYIDQGKPEKMYWFDGTSIVGRFF